MEAVFNIGLNLLSAAIGGTAVWMFQKWKARYWNPIQWTLVAMSGGKYQLIRVGRRTAMNVQVASPWINRPKPHFGRLHLSSGDIERYPDMPRGNREPLYDFAEGDDLVVSWIEKQARRSIRVTAAAAGFPEHRRWKEAAVSSE